MPGSSMAARFRAAVLVVLAWAAPGLWAGAAAQPIVAAPPAAVADLPPPPVPGGLTVAPVVLELYTAQGCAACPPADAMLAGLADRADVIALALHVDYWDYIGWVDSFAHPEFAQRQIRYARSNGLGTIYTPQVVINGTDLMEGFRIMPIMEAIEAHLRTPPRVWVSLTRDAPDRVTLRGGTYAAPGPVIASRGLTLGGVAVAGALSAAGAEMAPPHDVQLIRYLPHAEVEITAGENAGRLADYVNIVTEWRTVGTWDLRGELSLPLEVPGDQPVVVLVQEAGQGAIVAAARLE